MEEKIHFVPYFSHAGGPGPTVTTTGNTGTDMALIKGFLREHPGKKRWQGQPGGSKKEDS
jgi:hypothetical protein